jgi:hypothetical protein
MHPQTLKTYHEFIGYYGPIIYQKYIDKLLSVKVEHVLNLFLCMNVSFSYKPTRRSTMYRMQRKIIKESKVIGKVKKRTRKRRKVIQEVRTDRKPTIKEIKSGDYTKSQQVTTKIFNQVSDVVLEEFIDPKPTLEIISIKHEDLNEIIDVEIPVMDVEFIDSIKTEVTPVDHQLVMKLSEKLKTLESESAMKDGKIAQLEEEISECKRIIIMLKSKATHENQPMTLTHTLQDSVLINQSTNIPLVNPDEDSKERYLYLTEETDEGEDGDDDDDDGIFSVD